MVLTDNDFQEWSNKTVENLRRNPHIRELVNMHSGNGFRPLHKAAWCCPDPDVIICLISNGARVNEQDSDNSTPLHYAARHNNVDIVSALLHCNDVLINDGIEVEAANVNVCDNNGRTPFDYAQENPNLVNNEIIELLRP